MVILAYWKTSKARTKLACSGKHVNLASCCSGQECFLERIRLLAADAKKVESVSVDTLWIPRPMSITVRVHCTHWTPDRSQLVIWQTPFFSNLLNTGSSAQWPWHGERNRIYCSFETLNDLIRTSAIWAASNFFLCIAIDKWRKHESNDLFNSKANNGAPSDVALCKSSFWTHPSRQFEHNEADFWRVLHFTVIK